MSLPVVVADCHIPYLEYLRLLPLNLIALEPSEITNDILLKNDATALLIRTRTRVDHQLLKGTKVEFVGTATIGTDHIDQKWCISQGIKVAAAPGCNAGGVMQYVAAAIAQYCKKMQIAPEGLTLGVIGKGNTGSLSDKVGQALGMHVLVNDPPLADAGCLENHTPLLQLLAESDIVTIHVPYSIEGPYPTKYLIHNGNLHLLKPRSLIINTSRGGVVEEQAILRFKNINPEFNYALDVWENEPNLNINLLNQAFIATPHIAGYSIDGKRNASLIIFNALKEHFGWDLVIELPAVAPPPSSEINAPSLLDAILQAYPILKDDQSLRRAPEQFENLRSSYAFRHEFKHFTLLALAEKDKERAKLLGFKIL
ncbi:MAG: 4-phosphoerythronate dehydrogenase [Bacteroidales bacterium]|jgi:erythronate-4-phosphate dehydrogenase|nr:4-phosphoerythronate dehydrogenase [Bacteroidales bacterium]